MPNKAPVRRKRSRAFSTWSRFTSATSAYEVISVLWARLAIKGKRAMLAMLLRPHEATAGQRRLFGWHRAMLLRQTGLLCPPPRILRRLLGLQRTPIPRGSQHQAAGDPPSGLPPTLPPELFHVEHPVAPDPVAEEVGQAMVVLEGLTLEQRIEAAASAGLARLLAEQQQRRVRSASAPQPPGRKLPG